MPNGSRIRANNVFGIVNDAPLAPGATTFNSNQLVLLPQIFGDHAIITLDPIRKFGEPEIVIVTAHTASSTVATIQRGAYGTNAREHPQDTVWVHAALDEDFTEILTSGTRPTDPYAGQTIFETDTETFVARDAANGAWVNPNMWADPPACRVFHNANQSISHSAAIILAFNSERYDTAGMHDTAINNSRITVPVPGLYLLTFHGHFAHRTDFTTTTAQFRLNGSTVMAIGNSNANSTSVLGPRVTMSTVYRMGTGDYVEVQVYHTNGGSAAVNFLASAEYSPEFTATWIGRG